MGEEEGIDSIVTLLIKYKNNNHDDEQTYFSVGNVRQKVDIEFLIRFPISVIEKIFKTYLEYSKLKFLKFLIETFLSYNG